MPTPYRMRWLDPVDATRIARLERRVYPWGDRTGRRDIHEQLAVAERDGENLSMGLFQGRALRGYCLAFLERERSRIAGYLGVQSPAGLDLDGPGIYLADIAVHPGHRDQTWALVTRQAMAIKARADCRGLPVEALCAEQLLEFWRYRAGAVRRLGLELQRYEPFTDPDTGRRLYWLQFRQLASRPDRALPRSPASVLKEVRAVRTSAGRFRVGVVDSLAGWHALDPDWQRLWEQTPGVTVFSNAAFLRAWWLQLGVAALLHIIVVLDVNDRVRAIAPMQLLRRPGAGPDRVCLGFIGLPSEVDRPVFLALPGDDLAADVVAEYLTEPGSRPWSSVTLYEQRLDSLLLRALQERLAQAGALLACPEGPACPSVDVSGQWPDYLAGRSRGQRRSLRRHLTALRQRGTVGLDSVDAPDHAELGLRRYLKVEARSWKARSEQGVGRSSAHVGFLQALIAGSDGGPELHFRFLTVDGNDVAATLGLHLDGCLYALHIAHDRNWDSCSPGFVLTALELEAAFLRPDYRRVDYLGGFLSNKRGWAMQWEPSVALFAHEPSLTARALHLYQFGGKQLLKKALARAHLLATALRWQRSVSRRLGRYV